jgi:hypothetical protein
LAVPAVWARLADAGPVDAWLDKRRINLVALTRQISLEPDQDPAGGSSILGQGVARMPLRAVRFFVGRIPSRGCFSETNDILEKSSFSIAHEARKETIDPEPKSKVLKLI